MRDVSIKNFLGKIWDILEIRIPGILKAGQSSSKTNGPKTTTSQGTPDKAKDVPNGQETRDSEFQKKNNEDSELIGDLFSLERCQEDEMSSLVAGIDLGTCTSSVGTLSNSKVVILSLNSQSIVPSCVAFEYSIDEEEGFQQCVGDRYHPQEQNVAVCAKRLLGREYEDEIVQKDIATWPCRVVSDFGRPKYLIKHGNRKKTYFPEEISAIILKRLKTLVEEHHDGKMSTTKLKQVVITVPACFNQNQRKATRIAAQLAGLEVMNFVSEPCAAAVAYAAAQHMNEIEQKLLVFDFGGGTLDVTILRRNREQFRVITIGGDPHLGGEDIDNALAEYLLERFNCKTNLNLRKNNRKVWNKLKQQSEKTKKELSIREISKINLRNLYEQERFAATIYRENLENVIAHILQKAMNVLKEVIGNSCLEENDIDKVLMVGGTSKIPKMRDLLVDYFGMSKIVQQTDNMVSHAVTKGATIMAAQMSMKRTNSASAPITDVLPFSVGFQNQSGKMVRFMNRNAAVPVESKVIFSTNDNNQAILVIKIYEGEDETADNNFFIGEVRMGGIPPAPAGKPRIRVTFRMGLDGNLTATAVETGCGVGRQLSCQYQRKGMTQEDVELALQ